MQKIIVNQLEKLSNIELEPKNFNVFYGSNHSGKTSLAKTIYFYKSFREELQKFLTNAIWSRSATLSISTFNRLLRTKFLRLFGPTYGHKNIDIQLIFDNEYTVSIGLKGKYVDFNFYQNFKENVFDYLVAKIKKFLSELSNLKNIEGFDIREEKRKFTKIIANEINTLLGDNKLVLYFPTQRDVVNSYTKFEIKELENNNYLLFQLLEYQNQIKNKFYKSIEDLELKTKQLSNKEIDTQKTALARELIENILRTKMQIDSKGEKLYFSDTNYIRLNFASATSKSLAYLTHIIYLWILENKPIFTIIEHPENNLSPYNQALLVKLLALLANANPSNQILILTESPFIMQQIAHLIIANEKAKISAEQVKNLVNENFFIDLDNFKGIEFHDEQFEFISEEDILYPKFLENAIEDFLTTKNKLMEIK